MKRLQEWVEYLETYGEWVEVLVTDDGRIIAMTYGMEEILNMREWDARTGLVLS